MDAAEGAIVVTSPNEPKIAVTIRLTSPLIREMLLSGTKGGQYIRSLTTIITINFLGSILP